MFDVGPGGKVLVASCAPPSTLVSSSLYRAEYVIPVPTMIRLEYLSPFLFLGLIPFSLRASILCNVSKVEQGSPPWPPQGTLDGGGR